MSKVKFLSNRPTDAVGCGCERDAAEALAYQKARLAAIEAAERGYEAMAELYLDSVNYERRFMIVGELTIMRNECEREIRKLKKELKAKKKKGSA